jgi:hypothetical protein
MFFALAHLFRLVATVADGNDRPFLEAMEERIYNDTYNEMRNLKPEVRRHRMDRRHSVTSDFLGADRTTRLYARIERRIQWEQSVTSQAADAVEHEA